MSIITVQYESRKEPGIFGGRDYTYFADQDYEVGDIVAAPTRYGIGLALVTQVGVDEASVPAELRKKLKHVTGEPIPQQAVAPEGQKE